MKTFRSIKTTIELGEIFRKYGEAFRQRHRLSMDQHKALNAIAACRTAQLGGHIDQCDGCGHLRISYNSCRNRHCPQCQFLAKERWLEARKAELLNVKHFHLVFTLPQQLHPLIRMNEAFAYRLLFQVAAKTLLQLAKQKKYLHAQVGMMAVLHTWGQTLSYHPHLHCLVPAGGLSLDGKTWIHSRKNFFLPVKVMSRLFRGKFLDGIKEAFGKGELRFPTSLKWITNLRQLNQFLRPIYKSEWVVYAKAPFGGAEQVIQYLGRYTHRVAIANERILSLENDKVQFRYKDYQDKSKQKIMELEVMEFIRRFLMHILPSGFHKIRYYGLMATRNRSSKLAKARKELGQQKLEKPPKRSWHQLILLITGKDPFCCPKCRKGQMSTIKTLHPGRPPPVSSNFLNK